MPVIFPDVEIRESDHIHAHRYDDTCSRCRRQLEETEVPLLVWIDDEHLVALCSNCIKPNGRPGGVDNA